MPSPAELEPQFIALLDTMGVSDTERAGKSAQHAPRFARLERAARALAGRVRGDGGRLPPISTHADVRFIDDVIACCRADAAHRRTEMDADSKGRRKAGAAACGMVY